MSNMKLVEFKQAPARGYPVSVFVNPDHVAAITPVDDFFGRSDNRSLITLIDGTKVAVTDYPSAAAAKLSP